MNPQPSDLWTAAGVLLGFQFTAFAWRLSEEEKVRAKKSIPWIPPADFLNLAAMVINVAGVFLLPILRLLGSRQATVLLGLAALLFVGHPFAIAGHYQMYDRQDRPRQGYFPHQEKIAITVVLVLAIIYLIVAAIR